MQDMKIGMLGFGNVGTGVYKILMQNSEEILHRENMRIKVGKILVRDIHKTRPVKADKHLFTNRIEDIIEDPDISIVAEFMGGVEPAKAYILSAFKNKKTVVTANKELMARHWHELEKEAQQNGVGLYYEASVAGGIPIIKVINESLQSNKVHEMMGIINGTTNYILTKMAEEGGNFESILKQAQQLGYAEQDPSADIEGKDAMYKLSILSSIAFHARVPIKHIHCEGITNITKADIVYGEEMGFTMRLLAIAKKRGRTIEARVHPAFISSNHPLAAVREEYNAIFIKGDAVGNLMLYGKGAGDMPTGSAIVSDIISACQASNQHKYTTFYNEEQASDKVIFNDNWETEFFIRLTVKDKPGVLAKISGIFAKEGVSIASVIQKEHNHHEVPLVFLTHLAKEHAIKKAIKEIGVQTDVVRVENVIRVERSQNVKDRY